MSTKQALINSYLTQGVEKGFDNVSLQDIADAVSIKKASIFSHFRDYNDLKAQAIAYCDEELASKSFEINPRAANAEDLFLSLINSFLDVFTAAPVHALLCMISQKKTYDAKMKVMSEKIELMIKSRFTVALDFCVQRSWSSSNSTDELATLYALLFSNLLTNNEITDDNLSDILEVILATI